MNTNITFSTSTQTQTANPYPPVIHSDQFAKTILPPPIVLINGIIDQGSKLAIGGGSKSYKTWILMDLALSISTGNNWISFLTQPNRVLYVNFEIPAFRFQERLNLIAQAKGIQPPSDLMIWNLRGLGHVTDLKNSIQQTAGFQKVALVIIDPLYKYGGGIDENSTADMIKLFNDLDRINGAGHAVCYAGHFSKGSQAGKNPIDRVSGSGVHGREPDVIINFTQHKEKDAYTVDVILRYMPPVASFVVRWECPLFVIDNTLDPADLLKKPGRGGRKPKMVVAELLNILASYRKIIDTNAFYALVQDRVSRRTFDGLIVELRKLAGVTQLIDGQWIYTL